MASSTMLGADTGQLETLASRLATSTNTIADVQALAQSAAVQLTEGLATSFNAGVVQVDGHMSTLQTDITAAHAEMEATAWTGGNAVAFNAGFTEFMQAIGSLQATVHGGYAEGLQARLVAFSEEILEFQALIGDALMRAGESTVSMQAAVRDQAAILDAAMNGSMSFGSGGAGAVGGPH